MWIEQSASQEQNIDSDYVQCSLSDEFSQRKPEENVLTDSTDGNECAIHFRLNGDEYEEITKKYHTSHNVVKILYGKLITKKSLKW